MKIKNIHNISFEGGLLHLTSINQEIPFTIEYTKHSNRHFIFYNCKLIKKKELYPYSPSNFVNSDVFNYTIEYEKKFTSKILSEVESKLKIYIREKKLNILL